MKTFKFFVAAVAALMALACTQEEMDVLTMGSSEIKVPYEGVVKELEFKANTAWTIESDQDWVTFDETSGSAGDVVVTMTVQKNETYETRTAVVTISAGDKFTEITLKQGFATEFGSELVYDFDDAAHTVTYAVNTNMEYEVTVSEDAKSWIKYVPAAKAAPVAEVVTFEVAANPGKDRSGLVTVKAGDYAQNIRINQYGYIDMTEASAKYLANRQFIYDSDSWTYTDFAEYYLSFTSESGEAMTLSLNAETPESPLDAVPAGNYVVDASGKHPGKTFTIAALDGSVKYYTSITAGGEQKVIIDGTVSVAKSEDGTYTIIAGLYDDAGNIYRYRYVGAIAQIADDSFGANVTASMDGQYETYFSTKSNRWSVTFYINQKNPASDVYMTYFSVSLYASSTSTAEDGLPAGTYTYAQPEDNPESKYANGNLMAQPGDMTYFYGSDETGATVEYLEGSKIEVIKNADGTYDFKLDLKAKTWEYDDEYNQVTVVPEFTYAAEFKDVYVTPVVSNTTQPVPDVDTEFSSVMSSQYVALYFGDRWETGGATFVVGFNSVNGIYNLYLTLNQAASYTYEKNFNNRYCANPIEEGTYTFSKTPKAGEKSLVPVKLGAASYCYVQNGYTGTKLPITGGSVTLENGVIKYDIEASEGDVKCKFTGSHAATMYYARDYTKNAANLNIVE
ncbi:MAG: hypothetical protein E7123_02515 [Bacteroidales bacterium]|nr:hypothetical protein [Bacteroidales bacterium]